MKLDTIAYVKVNGGLQKTVVNETVVPKEKLALEIDAITQQLEAFNKNNADTPEAQQALDAAKLNYQEQLVVLQAEKATVDQVDNIEVVK